MPGHKMKNGMKKQRGNGTMMKKNGNGNAMKNGKAMNGNGNGKVLIFRALFLVSANDNNIKQIIVIK